MLFPLAEDLPFLAKPLTGPSGRGRPSSAARTASTARGVVPISVIGSGPDLNTATDNGLARAAELLG